MNRHLILFGACALALSSAMVGRLAAAAADDPATSAPTTSASGGDDNNNLQRSERPWWRGDGFRGRFSGLPASTRPVGTEKREEINKFMKENSPKRWAKLQDIPEERKTRIWGVVAKRYDGLMDLKQTDPRIFDLRIKRLPIEDEIFDLGWQLNHGKSDNKDELRAKLRQQVRALMDNRMDERRLRLKEWKERTDQEASRLKDDEANVDRMVDNNIKAIEKDRWPAMDFLGGGPGPGQRPPFMRPDRDNRELSATTQPVER